MSTVKLKHADVVAMYKDMDVETAPKWDKDKMQKRITSLPDSVKDEKDFPKSDAGKAILATILKAMKDKDKIEVTDWPSGAAATKEDKKEDKKESSKKEKSKDKKKSKKEEKSADSSDDKSSDDSSDDESGDKSKDKKKDKKKGKTKTKKGEAFKGPGVIQTIKELLEAATEEKPISKKRIVEKLAKKFPERDPESMAKTVNVQVPSRIAADKKLDVHRNDDGYWAGDAPKKKEKKKKSKSKDKD